MSRFWKKVYTFFADCGDWLTKIAEKKDNAIILVVLSFISPLGLFFALSFITSANRKKRRR